MAVMQVVPGRTAYYVPTRLPPPPHGQLLRFDIDTIGLSVRMWGRSCVAPSIEQVEAVFQVYRWVLRLQCVRGIFECSGYCSRLAEGGVVGFKALVRDVEPANDDEIGGLLKCHSWASLTVALLER